MLGKKSIYYITANCSLIMIDPKKKLAATLDMLFGKGISSSLPLDKLDFVYSKRTGKVKHVILDGKILCTFRKDGGIALSIDLARLLLKDDRFMEHCIMVSGDAARYIVEGRSVFCKHVKYAGSSISVGSEVAVLDEDRNIIAIGKAVLPSCIIRDMKSGVAVKVRDSIN
jgi:uncharacterized protein with predicted RNA binding PUA domain